METLGGRPEDLILHLGSAALLKGRVSIVENPGELVMAHVSTGGAEPLIVKLPGSSRIKAGDKIALTADAARLHLFDAERRALRG